MFRIQSILFCLLLVCPPSFAARDAVPQWNHINGVHFSLLTDALPKTGIEAELRFEQMRAVIGDLLVKSKLRLCEPLEIIGLANHAEYAAIAPMKGGQPISATGFFLPGADRNYAILDLSDDESWRTIAYPLAKVFLSYNYPQTQPWFDEGFAQYVSSLRPGARPAQIGGDPAAFAALLNAQPWISMRDLFSMREPDLPQDAGRNLFSAESWMVMHYVLSQNKLPETGTYFGLVENQNVPIAAAIQQAYGMDAVQFEKTIQDYFHSIAPALQAPRTGKTAASGPIQPLPTLIVAGDVGTSLLRSTDPDAHALVAEAALRVPERRDVAVQQLEALCANPATESVIAHRALAWDHLQKKEYDLATEELAKAADVNPHDMWVHYDTALVKYQKANAGADTLEGLPNMMQDLRAVIDLDPDFAEAYNMLALAQLQGGGTNAALATIRSAIALSPRKQSYVLNLAHIYLAGKKWDAATTLLERLQNSNDSQIASVARRDLEDLPTLKKYGILPQRAAPAKPPPPVTSSSDESASAEEAAPAPTEAQPDLRKSQSLKGKLLSVDCSQAPAAILRVAAGSKLLKLRTDDYKSLLLIGPDEFSCAWKNLPVLVNYKAGGKSDGDLVSLEAQ